MGVVVPFSRPVTAPRAMTRSYPLHRCPSDTLQNDFRASRSLGRRRDGAIPTCRAGRIALRAVLGIVVDSHPAFDHPCKAKAQVPTLPPIDPIAVF